MTEQQSITWTDAAQKFLVPALLFATSTAGAMLVSEMQSLRKEMQNVQVEIARLQVKVELISTRPAPP